jgi:hypothetical protein
MEEFKMAKKRKTKKAAADGNRVVDNSKGSPLWAYNYMRTRMLTSLLNDLVALEPTGLEDRYCDMVSTGLEYFINASTEIPSGGFLTGNISDEIEKFTGLYKKWNDIRGTDEKDAYERHLILGQLRNQRQRITDVSRKVQLEIEKNMDVALVFDTYEALGGLIKLVPNLFTSLAGAFGEYVKRGGKVA